MLWRVKGGVYGVWGMVSVMRVDRVSGVADTRFCGRW